MKITLLISILVFTTASFAASARNIASEYFWGPDYKGDMTLYDGGAAIGLKWTLNKSPDFKSIADMLGLALTTPAYHPSGAWQNPVGTHELIEIYIYDMTITKDKKIRIKGEMTYGSAESYVSYFKIPQIERKFLSIVTPEDLLGVKSDEKIETVIRATLPRLVVKKKSPSTAVQLFF